MRVRWSERAMSVGELFILGFYGKSHPALAEGLCRPVRARRRDPVRLLVPDPPVRQQHRFARAGAVALRRDRSALPSQPLVFIDQEGGRVRRLKDGLGFQPLPSAKDFNRLAMADKQAILAASYGELRRLGIRYNFAPAIDVDYNPDNPNIGRIKRSYSSDIGAVAANARLVDAAARQARDRPLPEAFSRHRRRARRFASREFMDISDALRPEQEELFYTLAPDTFGDAVLVSHAIVRQWDARHPMTLSPVGIGRLRRRLPETLLITDDMQMQGLQMALGTSAASLQAIAAGMDMICIGNNLLDQEQAMAGLAAAVAGASAGRIARSGRGAAVDCARANSASCCSPESIEPKFAPGDHKGRKIFVPR
jgi:beta-N-acetylhexosaminidase